MQIDPTNHAGSVTGPTGWVAPPAGRLGSDAALFVGSQALDKLLQATPDVRPEMVVRGKQLLETTSYPPEETIQRISKLLASNIDRTSA